MMRTAAALGLVVGVLAACDLRAAPNAAPPRDAPAVGDAAAAPPTDADVASLCMTAANHIADIVIAESDQAMRAAVTPDRGRMVQTIANGCTNEHWSDDWIVCATKAPNRAALDRCRK